MIVQFLRHPLTAFLAIILGVLCGIYFPEFARSLSDLSNTYLLLMQMTVVPILVSAIISSVGQFIQNPSFPHIAARALKVVVILMLFVVLLALFVSLIFKPGSLSREGTDYLSRYIGSQTDVLVLNLDEKEQVHAQADSFLNVFLKSLIPANMFAALSQGKSLALAFISIIIGVAAGIYQLRHKKQGKTNALIDLCDNIFSIFQLIISAVLVLLPVALVFIIANLIAQNGLGMFIATIRLITTFYVLGVILLLLNSMFLAISTRRNFFQVLRVSLTPSFLGFVTKSSVATIPSCIERLEKGMDMDVGLAKLLVPLFLVLCRYGNLAYFAVITVFSYQIYHMQFGFIELLVVVVSLLFASIATAGATGFSTLGILSIAFLPLGIPVETILVILYAIDPIIDPMRTMLIVHNNFAAIGIIGGKRKYAVLQTKQ